jgi:hypothetical protein
VFVTLDWPAPRHQTPRHNIKGRVRQTHMRTALLSLIAASVSAAAKASIEIESPGVYFFDGTYFWRRSQPLHQRSAAGRLPPGIVKPRKLSLNKWVTTAGCAAAVGASLPVIAPNARKAALAMLQPAAAAPVQAIGHPVGKLVQHVLSALVKEVARLGAALLIVTRLPILQPAALLSYRERV